MKAYRTPHPDLLVLYDFALTSKMMSMEQFLSAAQWQGVLVHDTIETW